MTKLHFEKLKVGNTVILNKQCRTNAGMKCEVTYICEDRIWIKPIDGLLQNPSRYCLPDWNEISYKSASIT